VIHRVLIAVTVGLCGCSSLPLAPWSGTRPTPPAASPGNPAPPARLALLQPEDNPLKLVAAAADNGGTTRVTRLDVVLTALRVRVPRSQRARAEMLWNHLREDALDNATTLRLRHNGLRVGVGDEQWWEAVRAALDAIPGVNSTPIAPLRVPAEYPLALELDTGPHEQTLFFLADDGVLTGETWPQSRNVLRLSYALDLQRPDRIRLSVVPEVRQRLEGLRWVRNEAGVTQVPNYSGRAFGAAGFAADLEPGRFLLIAPGEQSGVSGLVGNSFLVSEEDGQSYDSYVFLRADVNHVAQRY